MKNRRGFIGGILGLAAWLFCPVAAKPISKTPLLDWGGDWILYLSSPEHPDSQVFKLGNGRGDTILCITASGEMHFSPHFTPTEQAEAFRQAMSAVCKGHCSFPENVDYPIGGR